MSREQARPGPSLWVDPILCDGAGYCAEIVPELVRLDDWGYPMVDRRPIAEPELVRLSVMAVARCPRVALSLRAHQDPGG